ncbi:uncharacterized protein BXZ73DRAFT_76115 [Epithele typhae]|uniref:uncharacterized protein n=1 Tax=Epithele typhae TaxID=378194 RepID=UPI0020077A5C|nr:uncharacterized protein BXZ73DRAFT_76115 [Epithele typhae]KAH9939422.1 hypothetical protein BXZ73DRAFT_76115 [Epithele typhae]
MPPRKVSHHIETERMGEIETDLHHQKATKKGEGSAATAGETSKGGQDTAMTQDKARELVEEQLSQNRAGGSVESVANLSKRVDTAKKSMHKMGARDAEALKMSTASFIGYARVQLQGKGAIEYRTGKAINRRMREEHAQEIADSIASRGILDDKDENMIVLAMKRQDILNEKTLKKKINSDEIVPVLQIDLESKPEIELLGGRHRARALHIRQKLDIAEMTKLTLVKAQARAAREKAEEEALKEFKGEGRDSTSGPTLTQTLLPSKIDLEETERALQAQLQDLTERVVATDFWTAKVYDIDKLTPDAITLLSTKKQEATFGEGPWERVWVCARHLREKLFERDVNLEGITIGSFKWGQVLSNDSFMPRTFTKNNHITPVMNDPLVMSLLLELAGWTYWHTEDVLDPAILRGLITKPTSTTGLQQNGHLAIELLLAGAKQLNFLASTCSVEATSEVWTAATDYMNMGRLVIEEASAIAKEHSGEKIRSTGLQHLKDFVTPRTSGES